MRFELPRPTWLAVLHLALTAATVDIVGQGRPRRAPCQYTATLSRSGAPTI